MMQWKTEEYGKGRPLPEWSTPPYPLMPALAVFFTFLAGMGDWKVLNNAYGALPKAFSIGVIACAMFCFWIRPDFERAKRACSYLPLFFALLAVYLVASLNTWVHSLSVFGSISRGAAKLSYQAIAIFYAVSMVYLFGKKAIDYFFHAMVLTNTAIILLEVPKYGVWESVKSVYEGIASFGEAQGFMRSLELHDLTFLFGQLLIYYLAFAPRESEEDRKKYRRYALICLFFLLLGFKRLAFPAILLALLFVFALRKAKRVRGWLLFLGIAAVVCSFLYIYLIYSGTLVELLHSMGVDMKGRDAFWTRVGEYYEFSVFWRGLGFEAVATLVSSWMEAGILNRSYPLHNDFLKVYVELGTLGLALWSGIQYIFYPQYWAKKHFSACAVLYFALIAYMSVTYLTDNTAFYYWSSIGLRLIPMAYSYSVIKEAASKPDWQPSNASQIANAVREFELEQSD